jgi:glucose-1-phosphate adenylyltransferase
VLPASQRTPGAWYVGTADAVYQNIDFIDGYRPTYTVILAGDHIYKMDYEIMLQQHVAEGADVTVGCIDVPKSEASDFGVMQVDANERIVSFLEKPKNPPTIPGKPDVSLASMGIYVFKTSFLFDQLRADAANPNSSHDFGKDIIPGIVKSGKAIAHRFVRSCVRSGAEPEIYWRDVGTVDAYWEANIDLCDVVPSLDLYHREWPIWTYAEITPPAKFVHNVEGRRGMAVSSSVSGGCIVSGAYLHRSLLFTGVRVNSYTQLDSAVVLPHARIGRGAKLSKVIIDSGVQIPEGMVAGFDAEYDAKRFRRSEKGVCLITQPMIDKLRT